MDFTGGRVRKWQCRLKTPQVKDTRGNIREAGTADQVTKFGAAVDIDRTPGEWGC